MEEFEHRGLRGFRFGGGLLTEVELREAEEEYGEDTFVAGMGAEAIQDMRPRNPWWQRTLVVGIVAGVAVAQETTGEIEGVVIDPDGLALPGAVVKVLLTGNEFLRPGYASNDGVFLNLASNMVIGITAGLLAAWIYNRFWRIEVRSRRRRDVVEVGTADTIDNIGNGFVTGMELFEFLVSEYGIGVSSQIEMGIGNFQFRQNCVTGKRVPVPQLLERGDRLFVITGLIVGDTFMDQLFSRFILFGLEPRAAGTNQQNYHTGGQQWFHGR